MIEKEKKLQEYKTKIFKQNANDLEITDQAQGSLKNYFQKYN